MIEIKRHLSLPKTISGINFDKQMKKMMNKNIVEDFDKEFNRIRRMAYGCSFIAAILYCVGLAGIAFVIYKLLLHFKII